jgi:hypothetical protein
MVQQRERQRDQPAHGCERDKARSRQSIGQQIGHQSRPQSVALFERWSVWRERTRTGMPVADSDGTEAKGCFFARARSATLRVSSAPGDLAGATKRRVFLDDESTGDWLSKSDSHLLSLLSPPERAHVTRYTPRTTGTHPIASNRPRSLLLPRHCPRCSRRNRLRYSPIRLIPLPDHSCSADPPDATHRPQTERSKSIHTLAYTLPSRPLLSPPSSSRCLIIAIMPFRPQHSLVMIDVDKMHTIDTRCVEDLFGMWSGTIAADILLTLLIVADTLQFLTKSQMPWRTASG